MSTLIHRFGSMEDFILWLEERSQERVALSMKIQTRYKREREAGFAAGLEQAAHMLRDSKFGDEGKKATELV